MKDIGLLMKYLTERVTDVKKIFTFSTNIPFSVGGKKYAPKHNKKIK